MEFEQIGAEVQDIAEPAENEQDTMQENPEGEGFEDAQQEETDPGEGEEGEEQPEKPWKNSVNAGFAAARRRAELEYQQKLAARDAEFARRFEGMTNPATGQPIRNEADYLEALDAQEALLRKSELEQAGIDPGMIDEAIQNNPLVRKANQLISQFQEQEGNRQLEDQLRQITVIDPGVKSLADIAQLDTFGEFDALVRQGNDLVDAYKIANFERLTSQKTQAARQAAINAVNGKSHLTKESGGTGTQKGTDIPEGAMDLWRSMFPDDTAAQLRERYNRASKA